MADDSIDSAGSELLDTMDGLGQRTAALTLGANAYASAMSRAFSQATIGGKQLDEVLKGLALRLSNMAVTAAFKPIASGIAGGVNNLFDGLFNPGGGGGGLKAAMGAIKPFAAGGVIGTPTYFPLTQGGVGLAGEAGPEAILPLSRGPDGRLGVAGGGGRATSINVHIATPDAESFRRSEVYVAGQIARAVARGQRGM